MNRWKGFVLIGAMALFAISCMGVTDEAVSELGGITGTTVTTNNLAKRLASSDSAVQSWVYLAKSSDTLHVLDSVWVKEGETFRFESLPAGSYDVFAQGEKAGGVRRHIDVQPGMITQITIQINVYIVQNFITQNITHVTVVAGAADVDSSKGLNLKLLAGDTLPVVLSFYENGSLVTRTYWGTLDASGNPVILSSLKEAVSDLPLHDSLPPFGNAQIVAKYVFDEKAGNAFQDSGPHGLNGRILSSVGLSYVPTGVVMQGAGASYSLAMPSLDSVMDYDRFAIRAVVKPSSWPYYVEGAICGSTHWNYGKETYGYELRIDKNGYVEFTLGQAESYAWTIVRSKQVLNLDAWSEITAIYDHGTVRLRVKGQEEVVLANVPAVNAHSLPLDIGYRSIATPRNQFAGVIHSIEIFEDSVQVPVVSPVDTTPSPADSASDALVDLQFARLSSTAIASRGTKAFGGTLTPDAAMQLSDSGLVFGRNTQGTLVFPSLDSLVNWSNFEVTVDFLAFSITGSEQSILNNIDIAVKKGIEIRIDPNGALRGQLGVGYWNDMISSSVIDTNTWHQVKLRVQNGGASLYLDGVLVGSKTGVASIPVVGQPLNVGYRSTSSPRNPFHGVIRSIVFRNNP